MSDRQAVTAAYEQIEFEPRSLRDAEDGAGDEPPSDPVDEERRINDQAFFVLAWGQLEADIEESCRDAIRNE